MRDKIIIIGGDPNSINSEIMFKCWKKLGPKIKKKIYFVANFELIKQQFKKLNYSINLKKLKDLNEESNDFKIINVDLDFKSPFNVNIKNSKEYVKSSLNFAHNLALEGVVKGIINCPINKKLLNKNFGVTEYLALKCKVKQNKEVMLIANKNFAVSPITTHIKIKHIAKNININKIINKVQTIHKWYIKQYNKKPKIGVLGLNPHNAEMTKGSEEVKYIVPAINKLKKSKINIKGPLVADTIFVKNYKKYDVIVGMYHDQVLSPFKSLYRFNAINITLGLKYLRLSPDHGVAVDIIGKNKADESSLLKCITFLCKS